MDRGLYIAMSGARQALQAQTLNSNNLANANTTGFRADFEEMRSQPVLYGPGLPTRVYAMTENPGSDFTPGALMTTGRDLDVAIHGEGWLAVQTSEGTEAYTRAGELRISANGILETAHGLPVIGNNGPIAIPPAQKIEIGGDGTISIIPQGGNPTEIAVIDRIKLTNPPLGNVIKLNDGLIHTKDGFVAEADANVKLASGTLESSNVNTIESMVNMIELQRHYEMQIKMMKNVDDNQAASAQIMRMV